MSSITSADFTSTMTKNETIFKLAPKSRRRVIENIILTLIMFLPLSVNVNNNKKRQINQMSFQSRSDNYVLFDDAKPGDIVMATVYNIKNPAYVEEDNIHKNYLVFGW